MERNFTNENFERFLRKNAEGFRMQPSDKVWKGISKHLSRPRRRFGIILGISLLMSTGLAYYLIEKQNTSIIESPEKANDKTGTVSSKNNIVSKQIPDVSGSVATNKLPKISYRNSSVTNLFDLNNKLINLNSVLENSNSFTNSLIVQNDFTPTIVDSYLENNLDQEHKTSPFIQTNAVHDPLSIESVTNSYQPRTRKSKIGFQVYFTPTVSYRKLSENKSYLNSASTIYNPGIHPGLHNINTMVTHKPDFGFEIGVAAKYPLSRNLKLRGGLQFNVNRYDIKVFNSPAQFATIRMTNGLDSLNTITRYNNINNISGYKTNWLQNFYFQVSAPVGVEFKLRGDDKMQFGIATTIQPTYVLGDRAYLISSDYKNYAEVPWLIRRWNINTNLETFVNYSTGRLKWQVGPQVRYQLLSSFVKKYPVKENLFDFGLKVGISLNNQ